MHGDVVHPLATAPQLGVPVSVELEIAIFTDSVRSTRREVMFSVFPTGGKGVVPHLDGRYPPPPSQGTTPGQGRYPPGQGRYPPPVTGADGVLDMPRLACLLPSRRVFLLPEISVRNIADTVADPGFPIRGEGCQPPRVGAPTYYLGKISPTTARK